MKQASVGSPYRVPPEPSRWPAIMLAVGVHALLLLFLVVGISWQNHQPAAVEAEVWDMKVQTAAPPPPPAVEQAEPEPEPEPAPPPPKVAQPVEPPQPAPDIRLEREKQRKEELRREQAEQKARDEAKAKELADKKAKDEALKKEQAKKEEAERKQKELAEKKEAEKKEKAEKLAKAKAEAAEKAKKEALRKDELQRMMAQAGTGTSGTAAKSTAPRLDSGYLAAITAKIKGSTVYANTDVPGNPKVTYRVEQLPTGEILSVKLVKSSGIPAFDDAVFRGINKSSPLPKKKDGTVERSLVVDFSMKDLD